MSPHKLQFQNETAGWSLWIPQVLELSSLKDSGMWDLPLEWERLLDLQNEHYASNYFCWFFSLNTWALFLDILLLYTNHITISTANQKITIASDNNTCDTTTEPSSIAWLTLFWFPHTCCKKSRFETSLAVEGNLRQENTYSICNQGFILKRWNLTSWTYCGYQGHKVRRNTLISFLINMWVIWILVWYV